MKLDHPGLQPVLEALSGSSPSAVLRWLEPRRRAQPLLTGLAAGSVTHETLDQMPLSKAVAHLRAVLVSAGLLPERDQYLADLERWVPRALAAVQDPEERRLLQTFATWAYLRRLRRRSAKSPVTYLQAADIKRSLKACIRLISWLKTRELTLATCTQHDIDQWLTEAKTAASYTRGFVAWCVKRNNAHNIEIPVPGRLADDRQQLESDERWRLSRRLLRDAAIPAADRVSGCLVLLYGQPLAKVITLTTTDVSETVHGIRLSLGPRPADIPEPLGSLLLELVRERTGYAVVGIQPDNQPVVVSRRSSRPSHYGPPAHQTADGTRHAAPTGPFCGPDGPRRAVTVGRAVRAARNQHQDRNRMVGGCGKHPARLRRSGRQASGPQELTLTR